MRDEFVANKDTDLNLDLASQVQKILFPASPPTCTWGEIGLKNRMAQGIGGDYFDFLPMSDGCQVLFLGDVTGHGLHASLIMALLYGYIHRAFSSSCSCRDIISQLNGFLLSFASRTKDLDQYFSASMFYGVINPRARNLTYINAGHPPPLVSRGDTLLTLAATSPPLGFFEEPHIIQEDVALEPGDRLLLYTDGITEATNPGGAPFGRERLESIVRKRDCDHLGLLDNIFRTLTEFTGRDLQDDDCTAIFVDFHGYPSGPEEANSTRAGFTRQGRCC